MVSNIDGPLETLSDCLGSENGWHHPARRFYPRAPVAIDRGEVRKRKKGPSKEFSNAFSPTPLFNRG
jgi:hypothetical protein